MSVLALDGCSTSAIKHAQPRHAVGFHDLKGRVRLVLTLPDEFIINEDLQCNDLRHLDGILSCGAHGEGAPSIPGYFEHEQAGLFVSGWISVMGPILGPDAILSSFEREGVVKVHSLHQILIDGHPATIADIENTSQKPTSTNRYERWVMFKLKNMAGGITFSEYQGSPLSYKDLDMFGAHATGGISQAQWKLDSVVVQVIRDAKIYLPDE